MRERRQDIPVLARHFLEKHDFSRRLRKELSRAAERGLVAYDWPGNVRELRNTIERAIIISGSDVTIQPHHLGLPVDRVGPEGALQLSFDHEPTLEEMRARYVRMAFERYSGHRANIATALGVSERNVYRLLEKYDLAKG